MEILFDYARQRAVRCGGAAVEPNAKSLQSLRIRISESLEMAPLTSGSRRDGRSTRFYWESEEASAPN